MASKKGPKKVGASRARKPSRLDELKSKWLGGATGTETRRAVARATPERPAEGESDSAAAVGPAPVAESHGPLSWDQIEAIVQHDLPGHKVLRVQTRHASDSTGPRPEAVSVGLKAMQKKYWNDTRGADAAAPANPSGAHDAIVVVQPDSAVATDSPTNKNRGPGLKVAVISAKDKKIIGMQG